MMVTLSQILGSRDRRAAREKELLRLFPGCSLVCLTVIPPGSEKRSKLSVAVGSEGVRAVSAAFGEHIVFADTQDLETGFEHYAVVDMDPLAAKRRAIAVEEEHPLGRLMDIDVMGEDGIPLERASSGAPPRRCLICDKPAHECMRSRTHTPEELLSVWRETVRSCPLTGTSQNTP